MVIQTSPSNATSGLNNQSLLVQNLLFLHPCDGPGTLVVNEKLIGAQNFRSWKRSVEIALPTKRKLGFIKGTVPRSPDDASLQERWDTCNNLLQLKTRFALSNGSHKYKMNREIYDTMQAGKSVIIRNSVLVENEGHVVFTSKQFEQLLKSLPQFNQAGDNSTDMEHPFGEDNNDLDDVYVLKNKQVVNLPNGHTSVISKVGNVTLENKLKLKNVLIVPSFKFRLLSVSKLTKDSQCFVTFYEQFSVIQDLKTRKVLGLGKKKAGLYHLLNLPLDPIHAQLSSMVVSALEDCSLYSFFSNCSVPNTFAFSVFNNKYSLWHHRLGHVSNTTLKHILVISKCVIHTSNELNQFDLLYGKKSYLVASYSISGFTAEESICFDYN
ncbi:retrovirus-related pol polyprotein from transposon TNT 1-94 [Tanacetum coccineum]|uniref:Retrovirus-related pol polyprotein from transposon TNT 1-94 n=1 Tax=Tanacetum coccineum TaxID=301880 RepID=A0ABQ5ARA8_9ASTR